MEYTRQVHEVALAKSSSSRDHGRNNGTQLTNGDGGSSTDFDRKKQQISSRIAELDAEVESYKINIIDIQNRMEMCLEEKKMLERQLALSCPRVDKKGKGKVGQGINYMMDHFDWSEGLKARMKAVFGIHSFRLCQEGWVFQRCLLQPPNLFKQRLQCEYGRSRYRLYHANGCVSHA